MHRLKWSDKNQRLEISGQVISGLVPVGEPVLLRGHPTFIDEDLPNEINKLGLGKSPLEINAYALNYDDLPSFAQLYHIELRKMPLKNGIAGLSSLSGTGQQAGADPSGPLAHLHEDWNDYALRCHKHTILEITPVGRPFSVYSNSIGYDIEIGAYPREGFDKDVRRQASQNYRNFNSYASRFISGLGRIDAIIQLYYAVLEKEGE